MFRTPTARRRQRRPLFGISEHGQSITPAIQCQDISLLPVKKQGSTRMKMREHEWFRQHVGRGRKDLGHGVGSGERSSRREIKRSLLDSSVSPV
jgi:hypothetical protein